MFYNVIMDMICTGPAIQGPSSWQATNSIDGSGLEAIKTNTTLLHLYYDNTIVVLLLIGTPPKIQVFLLGICNTYIYIYICICMNYIYIYIFDR